MEAATFDAILADVAAGTATYKALPKHGSNFFAFYGELAANAASAEKYARAKFDGLEMLADEIVQLSDECRIGEKWKETKDGNFKETGDMVERTKLQIDARKWLLSKLAPKKYGDRLDLTSGGEGFAITVIAPKAKE